MPHTRHSRISIALAWTCYVLHTALTLWAAFSHVWLLQLPLTLRVGGGITAICVGSSLYLASVMAFRSSDWATGRKTAGLVTHGVYHFSRHPQYVGWTLVLAGIATLGQSGVAVLLTALLAGAFVIVGRSEERQLAIEFGEPYQRWRRRTPAILGWHREKNPDG